MEHILSQSKKLTSKYYVFVIIYAIMMYARKILNKNIRHKSIDTCERVHFTQSEPKNCLKLAIKTVEGIKMLFHKNVV